MLTSRLAEGQLDAMLESLARVDRIHDTMQRHIKQLENEQKQVCAFQSKIPDPARKDPTVAMFCVAVW